jgi:uncharacterized protein YjiK
MYKILTLLFSGLLVSISEPLVVLPELPLLHGQIVDHDHPVSEPSGMVWHPLRHSLFILGDGGDLQERSQDGKLLRATHLPKGDWEGITVDPRSGQLYLAREGAEAIQELDVESLKLLRKWPLPRSFLGQGVMAKADNEGLEGIAFVPDLSKPHGGTFFVANQFTGKRHSGEANALFEIEIPLLSETLGQARILSQIDLVPRDLADLCYDSKRQQLIVVSDLENLVIILGLDGIERQRFSLTGRDQEGIAFDDQGHFWIGQDSGDVLRYDFDSSILDSER